MRHHLSRSPINAYAARNCIIEGNFRGLAGSQKCETIKIITIVELTILCHDPTGWNEDLHLFSYFRGVSEWSSL